LLIETFQVRDGKFEIGFSAQSGRSYSVLYTDALPGTWRRLKDIAAGANPSFILVEDDRAGASQRYYRLVSPALEP
jgi:hypothetical protein